MGPRIGRNIVGVLLLGILTAAFIPAALYFRKRIIR